MREATAIDTVGWEIVDPVYYGRYGYPHASWAWLRRHAPVARFAPPGMLPFWAITKYEDCGVILRDYKRFQIAPRLAVFPEEQFETDAFPFRHLLNMDPPEHGKYRGLLSHRFTPRALEGKRPAVGRIVDDLLDGLVGRSEFDFVESVAAILPLAVIAEMLGVPRADWDRMFRLSNALLGASDPRYQEGAGTKDGHSEGEGWIRANLAESILRKSLVGIVGLRSDEAGQNTLQARLTHALLESVDSLHEGGTQIRVC